MLRSLAIVLGLMLFSAPSLAQSLAHLRTPAAGCGSVSNCFTSVYDLTNWLWGTRSPLPSATDPVTVIIGAGNHVGNIDCDVAYAPGYATFRGDPGASRNPKLTGEYFSFPPATISSRSCTELAFENLTIEGPPISSSPDLSIGVYWEGSGNSRWIDVDVSADYIAWYDSGCETGSPTPTNASPPAGMHYVQRSTWTGGSVGWYADCGEALFYDSSIIAEAGSSTTVAGFGALGTGSEKKAVVGLAATFRAELYLVDSIVRADKTSHSTALKAIGLLVGTGANDHPDGAGEIEMFGGSLTVKGNTGDLLYGARANKYSETTNPATVRIQGTQLTIQNGTAAVAVVAGDGELERVDLAP